MYTRLKLKIQLVQIQSLLLTGKIRRGMTEMVGLKTIFILLFCSLYSKQYELNLREQSDQDS